MKKPGETWRSASKTSNASPHSIFVYRGIVVPGGFGDRGIEGMILACEYARKNNVPFFGICLGMQCAVIEVRPTLI